MPPPTPLFFDSIGLAQRFRAVSFCIVSLPVYVPLGTNRSVKHARMSGHFFPAPKRTAVRILAVVIYRGARCSAFLRFIPSGKKEKALNICLFQHNAAGSQT